MFFGVSITDWGLSPEKLALFCIWQALKT